VRVSVLLFKEMNVSYFRYLCAVPSALDARCAIALANVVRCYDPRHAKELSEPALHYAALQGYRDGREGINCCHLLSSDLNLHTAWCSGYLRGSSSIEAGAERSASRQSVSGDSFDESAWRAVCDYAARDAVQRSSCSHDLYVYNFSASIDGYVYRIPVAHRSRAIRIARSWDYASRAEQREMRSWNHENGYCPHGIELGCCPAGCGS